MKCAVCNGLRKITLGQVNVPCPRCSATGVEPSKAAIVYRQSQVKR